MMLVCALIVFMIKPMISALPMESPKTSCPLCQPGHYQKACGECVKCPDNTFTNGTNRERHCLPCYSDCRDDFNMILEAKCTSTSDARCRCKKGFTCTSFHSTGNCDHCQPLPEVVQPCKNGTFFNASSQSCHPHTNCKHLGLAVDKAGNATKDTVCTSAKYTEDKLWYILAALLAFVVLLGIFFLKIQLEEGTCLKRVMRSYSPTSHGGKCEPSPQNGDGGQHTSNTGNKQQTPQVSGNLGPFHIYSPGTVFVSLLNQVTGLERDSDVRKSRQQQQSQLSSSSPPSSPSVPLSEEEKSGQEECLFFPYQEQGKETHLSKEEILYKV